MTARSLGKGTVPSAALQPLIDMFFVFPTTIPRAILYNCTRERRRRTARKYTAQNRLRRHGGFHLERAASGHAAGFFYRAVSADRNSVYRRANYASAGAAGHRGFVQCGFLQPQSILSRRATAG